MKNDSMKYHSIFYSGRQSTSLEKTDKSDLGGIPMQDGCSLKHINHLFLPKVV